MRKRRYARAELIATALVLTYGRRRAVRRPAVLGFVAVVADCHQTAPTLARPTDRHVAGAVALRGHLQVAAGAVITAEVASRARRPAGRPGRVHVERAPVAGGDDRGRGVRG